MIIHQPETYSDSGEIILRSRVELNKPMLGIPNDLWFAFPEVYSDWVSDQSDAFAAGLLQTAMYLGEDVEIRGACSARLAYGLWEYMRVFHAWYPKIFSLVNLKFARFTEVIPIQTPGWVAAAFSGGLDSFYTLWAHLPDQVTIPPAQITHGLFIQGFDIPLADMELFHEFSQRYSDIFRQHGLELITARTNGHAFWEYRLKWDLVHGGMLIGAAHCLSPRLRRFYVPATHDYSHLLPLGTSPLVDHLLSSEAMEISHSGAHLPRYAKLEALSNWEPARQSLMVCVDPSRKQADKNCSRCEKCLRTMLMAEVMGIRSKYASFSPGMGIWNVLRYIMMAPSRSYPQQIYHLAIARRKYGISCGMFLAQMLGAIKHKMSLGLATWLSKEAHHRLKRWRFGGERKITAGDENM